MFTRKGLPLITVLLLACAASSCRREPAPAPRCAVGMKPVAGGTIELGKTLEVTVDGFCLDETEVTVAAYARCVANGQCRAPASIPSHPLTPEVDSQCNADKPDKQQHPINCVAWKDASDYCRAASKRLPTEAEWERAADGGEEARTNGWGESWPTQATACWSIAQRLSGTCAVGSYPASSFQLRDMEANVSEWVSDWFGDYPSKAAYDYRGPVTGARRITRGAGWSTAVPKRIHSTQRIAREPEFKGPTTGFRCASSG